MSWIVGCDTGGTFTDLVRAQRRRGVRVAKVPSTPPDFDRAVIEGVRALGIPSGDIRRLFHGTTVTTNAVITKRGAATGARHHRGLPRHPRDPPREPRGALRHPLGPAAAARPATPPPRGRRAGRLRRHGRHAARRGHRPRRRPAKIRARGLESVAVCLINAHMNPAHERRVREILLEEIPELQRLALDRHPAGAAGVRADRDDGRQRLLRADAAPLHGRRSWRALRRGRLQRATSCS